MLIYKILRQPEWQDLRQKGETLGAPLDVQDGYIHFSTASQVVETASKHFANEPDLMLLALESEALAPNLKWEASRGGALFPHLYAPLRLCDVIWEKPLPLAQTGHIFPETLS